MHCPYEFVKDVIESNLVDEDEIHCVALYE